MILGGRRLRHIAVAGLVLLVSGCANNLSSLPELPPAESGPYELGAGDRVRLQVFGQEELSQEYVVSDAGTITMPLIGSVAAEGSSLPELEDNIETQLRDGILVEPSVSAEIVTYRPFYVLGETKAPGQYPYVPRMTVLTAVSISGGFTFRAEEDAVSITRLVDGQMSEFRADPLALVEPGDVVYVHERLF